MLSLLVYQEILGFVTRENNWMQYNWTHITTLAMFTDFNSSLMCYAHSRNVRVVIHGSYPVSELVDVDKRKAWVQTQLQMVQELYADGINIDIEDPTIYEWDESISSSLPACV